MDPITTLQADVLKSLANANRLAIVHRLADGPTEVGRLASELGLSQPNVSQHLAVLRAVGLVEVEREGREARYRIVDPDVIVACGIMRRVLERHIARLASISTVAGGTAAFPAAEPLPR